MMELLLFTITLECTVVIAFNLCVLEMSATVNLEAIVALLSLLFILSMTFAHFYLSEWITTDLLSIGDTFYNSEWHRAITAKRRQFLVLPIQLTQREFRLQGLGLFDCSLAFFLSVNSARRLFSRYIEQRSKFVIKTAVLFPQILRTASTCFVILQKFK